MNQQDWMEMNEHYLNATLSQLRYKLQQLAPTEKQLSDNDNQQKDETESSRGWFRSRNKTAEVSAKQLPPPQHNGNNDIETISQQITALEASEPPPALLILAKQLGLSRFDQQVLALCIAMELDTRIATLCAKAQNNANKTFPTFALAFALFDDPDWSALSPHAPLRYWRLLEINQSGTQPLTSAILGVDERIVNYVKGLNYLDDRLTTLIDPLTTKIAEQALPRSQQNVVDLIIAQVNTAATKQKISVIELLGHDSASKRLVAAHVASALKLTVHTLALKSLPTQNADFETFSRLWSRESFLMPLALYIQIESISDSEKALLKRFLQRTTSIIFIEHDGARLESLDKGISIEVNKPLAEEQERIWSKVLNGLGAEHSKRLSEQFSFSQNEIINLAESIQSDLFDPETFEKKSSQAEQAETVLHQPKTPEALSGSLDNIWQACRLAARSNMEQLAKRIDVKANWEQLVLPPEQLALLHQITDQVSQRSRVYEDWGFRERMNRGLGINALFAGESGTGKTMAAEVIANALQLDLYRIDLSAVVSKYIGETEKNLRQLFNSAEDSGAILFFDEADALFGKRSEVKDSHDRFANIEIDYLLQRMESYRGLAILATNLKSALDKAFIRRLRFIVDFPFPGIEERTEIWRKVFPANVPLDESLDLSRLAKFNLTGGNIHNVALNAAFLAAQENSVITMPLLFNATRTEFRKLERPTKESDFRWQSAHESSSVSASSSGSRSISGAETG